MIRSLIAEYGILWTIFRIGYSFKLKLLKLVPITEKLFEHKVDIKRIDIFNLDIEKISGSLQNLSETDKQTLITEAEEATRGIIKGFSSVKMDYGYPINWHLNPLTNVVEDKELKWFQIPDFDEKRGDIKAIWEASRFSHFITFARAFLLTGDHKYYQSFSEQLSDWLVNNSYSFGSNYKCGQECALRMINTLLAYSVFKQAGEITDLDTLKVKELVRGSYKKILSNFYYARRCIKNNHTLSELVGLIIGGWSSINSRRTKKAFQLLDSEIQSQFFIDGGYRQYSFNYQRFALQLMECVYKLSPVVGYSLSESSKKRVASSAQLLYQCMNSSGDLPNYGPNDGALIFPVTSSEYRDFRPVVNTIIAQSTGKSVFPQGKYSEECYWFGQNIGVLQEIPKKSTAFPHAGLFTLKNRALFVMICANEYNSRPGHMDQLHVDIWLQDKNIFCDSGSYSYASKIGRELSATVSHNTVKIAQKEQMNHFSNFLTLDWTTRERYLHSYNSFQATIKSKNGYKHTREVVLHKSSIIINDAVEDADEFSILFHTPYSVVKASEKVSVRDNYEELCWFSTDCEVKIRESYRSLYYLKVEKINCIELIVKKNNNKLEINFPGVHLI